MPMAVYANFESEIQTAITGWASSKGIAFEPVAKEFIDHSIRAASVRVQARGFAKLPDKPKLEPILDLVWASLGSPGNIDLDTAVRAFQSISPLYPCL